MTALEKPRVDWVDTAKGFCIVMVVVMHSTLGVGVAAGHEGWLHHWVAFAQPFRMPDFFLISGLFLARVIDLDWRTYLDRKVVHFFYFYVLWVTIQFAFKAPGLVSSMGVGGVALAYLEAFIEPFGTLWFIYLLPVFFVVTKLLRDQLPPLAILFFAAALEIAPIHTGWIMIDEFAARFVYFYIGYLFATHIFGFAAQAQAKPAMAAVGLAVWALINGAAVFAGLTNLPGLSLALGLVGAAAVVAAAALLAQMRPFDWLRYLGEHSIMVYLAFFLPMAISRKALLKLNVLDVGTVSLLVTICGVFGALCWYWAVRNTPARFLFERPAAFRLDRRRPQGVMQPAE